MFSSENKAPTPAFSRSFARSLALRKRFRVALNLGKRLGVKRAKWNGENVMKSTYGMYRSNINSRLKLRMEKISVGVEMMLKRWRNVETCSKAHTLRLQKIEQKIQLFTLGPRSDRK